MSQNRKQKLIEALKAERDLFRNRQQSTTEHDIAISFLELGYTKDNPDRHELLDAVMNDFECTCGDYDC